MATSITFCKMNSTTTNGYAYGCGIKKINQEILLNRHNNNVARSCVGLTSSIRHAVQSPLCSTYRWTQRCYNNACIKSSINQENRRNKFLPKAGADLTKVFPTEEKVNVKGDDEISRATLIWRAIKLPMYTIALIPVSVGTAAAYLETGLYYSGRYVMTLVSYVLVIAWLNLSNDVYDFDTGADKNKKESVVNIVGSRRAINIIAWLLLALGCAGLTLVAIQATSPRSLLLIASAVFCCYIYQCPPFRLGYYGLGEPLCFAAFGPFSTIAFYLLQSGTSELPITRTIISASTLVGFTSALILLCSHFHQIKDDKDVGKISPLVRLGTEKGSKVVKMAVLGLCWLVLAFGFTQTLPYACVMLCAMTLPVANLVVSFVQENHKDKTKIFMAKYYCVRLHAIFGAALATGLVASRMLATQQPISTIFS